MKYVIRKACLEDSYYLSILKKQLWESTYRGIYSDYRIDNYNYLEEENKFGKIIRNKNINLFVVVINNKIVGYMACGESINSFLDYKQELSLLYLHPDYQGLGIGRKLFELGYNTIKDNGYNKFFIGCNKYNLKAIAFYQKMGGNIIGIDKDIDSNDKYFIQVKFGFDIIN